MHAVDSYTTFLALSRTIEIFGPQVIAPLVSRTLRIRPAGMSWLSPGPDTVDIKAHAAELAIDLGHAIQVNNGLPLIT